MLQEKLCNIGQYLPPLAGRKRDKLVTPTPGVGGRAEWEICCLEKPVSALSCLSTTKPGKATRRTRPSGWWTFDTRIHTCNAHRRRLQQTSPPINRGQLYQSNHVIWATFKTDWVICCSVSTEVAKCNVAYRRQVAFCSFEDSSQQVTASLGVLCLLA